MLDSELVSPGDAAWIESFDFGKFFIAKAHRLPQKGMQINPTAKTTHPIQTWFVTCLLVRLSINTAIPQTNIRGAYDVTVHINFTNLLIILFHPPLSFEHNYMNTVQKPSPFLIALHF